MDWMYAVYFLLGALLFFGTKYAGKGAWNEEYTSLKQTKVLQGITALGIALHHMAQKTCAPWHPARYTVHGLDSFIPMGYLFVGVFLFCSGLGLYKSVRTKPDYLKGFFRRRVLPIVVAFYLSEFIYTGIRLLMGEQMDFVRILWYLSGLHMANFNAWYVIVIPFFYLVFWAAFRFCKREWLAISWVFLFTLAYAVFGAFIGHQDDWWMRGEWWYNSILLFPIGLLFGKFEKSVTGFFRRGYWFWLILSFAGAILLFRYSEHIVNNVWGYYGGGGTVRQMRSSLISAGTQWLAALAYVAFWFLLMMKVKIGNRLLALLGTITLDFYLMHGVFVELFGYNFLDISKSLVYIRSVPLYMAAVLACSVAASVLFRVLRLALPSLPARLKALKQRRRERTGEGKIRKWLLPAIVLALFAAGIYLLQQGQGTVRAVGGLKVKPPDGYTLNYTDSSQTGWKYTGSDKNPGYLILDETIQGRNAQYFSTAEDVMLECDWLQDREIYVNPNGIRMVRGFAVNSAGYQERRYYVENDSRVFMLCMIEDSRYYDTQDCEEAMQQTADGICRY